MKIIQFIAAFSLVISILLIVVCVTLQARLDAVSIVARSNAYTSPESITYWQIYDIALNRK